MSQSETWTIGRLLTWTTDYLQSQGCESARLDAEVLLAAARDCERIELYTAFDEIAGDCERTAFRELVRRRAEGTPVAYLVGHREFYSLSFRVTPDVLIPRPETELVVMRVLDAVKEYAIDDRPLEIADVGTGSGIIAVCLAKHVPSARLTAIDVSGAALKVAQANTHDHGVTDRVELIEGDLLTCLPEDRQFDFIACNPPYIAEPEMADLAGEVKDHEPQLALVSGKSGTEIIQRLIPQAAQRLRGGGALVMEISPMIEPSVCDLISAEGGFAAPKTVKDLAGLPRVIYVQRQ